MKTGLLTKESNAKDNTRGATVEEEVNLAATENKLKKHTGGTMATKEDVATKLNDEGKLTDEEFDKLTGQNGETEVDIITIGEKTHTVVKLGDTTGDGNLTPLDYVKIKNNIMKTTKLEGCYKLAGDTTGDGDITPLDYVKVKNNIMKISKITLSE